MQPADRPAEQRVAPEALDERGRVGVECEHEAEQDKRLLVGRAQPHEAVGALPRGAVATAGQRCLMEVAAVRAQAEPVRPARSDDVLEHVSDLTLVP